MLEAERCEDAIHAGFENGGRDREPRNAGLEAGNATEADSSLDP